MIKNIKISGFKSIAEMNIACKAMNIIAGANSSGKSTILQSILVAAQNRGTNSGINGEFVNLGEFKDAKNFNVTNKKIDIMLEFAEDVPFDMSRTITITEEGVDYNGFNDGVSIPNDFASVKYLSCNRVGAEDIYIKHFASSTDVGINGQYAIYCLEKNKSENVSKELIIDHNSYTLYSQVNYWLDYILDFSISTEDVVGTDYVKCFYTNSKGKQVRPKNTGAGLSYLISIIVMCLLSEKDSVIIIENPEIHLHPSAQSRVCEFLYFIAKSGRQLFIETHSDHIFNGVRAGIANKKMSGEDIAINFVTMDEADCTKNTVIEIGKRGRIMNYVEGLFDQFDIDLNRMLDI